MFDLINFFNFLFLFTLINFILICFLFSKMSILKKQNAENNMEIHEINKEILKLRGCFCEISNFLNNYTTIKENGENKENGNK